MTSSDLPTMKTTLNSSLSIAICLTSALLLTQCSTPRNQTAHAATAHAATPTPTGNVTVKALGDTTVATRTLIHHPLTNKDIGKVYEEITIVSPRGTSVEERVIVRALPKLETNVVSK
jgi:hypothetical protein